MQKIAGIVFILGVIALCSFLTPISHGGSTQSGAYVTESYVEYSNIFTSSPISVGRFFLYLTIWAVLCYALFLIFKDFKKKL